MRPTSVLSCLAILCASAGAALAQQPVPAQKTTVVKPPANVDPGIQVKPKPQAALPTPVVKPPRNVVPK